MTPLSGPTPMTDALDITWIKKGPQTAYFDMTDHARTLERLLADAVGALAYYANAKSIYSMRGVNQLAEETLSRIKAATKEQP